MSEISESTDNVHSADVNHQFNDNETLNRIEEPALSPNPKIPKMVRHFKDAEDRRLPWCMLPTNIDTRQKLKSFVSYMHFLKRDRYKRALNLLCIKECPIAKPVVCGNILDADIIFVSDDSKQRTKNYKISNRLIKDRFVIADTTISRRVLRRRRDNDDDPERDNKLKIVCVDDK